MDRRERVADPLLSLDMQLAGLQAKIWTSMPGEVVSYDTTKRTAVIQVTVQPQTRDAQGNWKNVTLPVLLDCPVSFPRGGGYGCTFPLEEGDEGIVHFSSRCIDAWWQSSGVQPQAEFRMHDLSDGMFVPGICSVPNVPENTSNTVARFWSEDGLNFVEIDKDTGIVKMKAVTRIVLEAPLTQVTGGFVVGGTVSGQIGGGGTIDFGDAAIMQGGKDIGATHTHGGVEVGGGTTGPVE